MNTLISAVINEHFINQYIFFILINILFFCCAYFLLKVLQKISFLLIKFYFESRNPQVLKSIQQKQLISRSCWFLILFVVAKLDDILYIPSLEFTRKYIAFIDHAFHMLMVAVMAIIICELLNVLRDYRYKIKHEVNNHIYGYIPILKFIVWLFAVMGYLSIIFSQSIFSILTSLGAVAALIAWILKDAIAGIIASFQNSINQTVQVGDWISIATNKVEGVVEEISVSTIKLRNFDNTYTLLPISIINQVAIKNNNHYHFPEGYKRLITRFEVEVASIHVVDNDFIADKIAKHNFQNIDFDNVHTNLLVWVDYINYFLKTTDVLSKDSILRNVSSDHSLINFELVLYANATNFEHNCVYILNQIAIFTNAFGIKLIYEKCH